MRWRVVRRRGDRRGAACFSFFFFNDPAPTETYPLPLHAALPISVLEGEARAPLHGGHHLLPRQLQLGFALDLLRPLLASHQGAKQRRQRACGPPPSHSCHSIPFPAATPTTRAIS